MLQRAVPVALLVQFGIVCKTILHRTANDGFRIDQPIRLCDDSTIDGTRSVVRRSTMILRSLCSQFNSLGRKPLQQTRIATDNAARGQVMRLATLDNPQVVVGRRHIEDLRIHIIVRSKLQRLFDYSLRVVSAVARIKSIIARNNLFAYKVLQGLTDRLRRRASV